LYVDSDFSAVFFDFGISRDAISLIRFKKKKYRSGGINPFSLSLQFFSSVKGMVGNSKTAQTFPVSGCA